jgi:hypothetical protein
LLVESKQQSQNNAIEDHKEEQVPRILQQSACYQLSKSLGANFCRECSSSRNKEKFLPEECRFFKWRKLNLAFNEKSNTFLSEVDVKQEDVDLWLPRVNFNKSINPPSNCYVSGFSSLKRDCVLYMNKRIKTTTDLF